MHAIDVVKGVTERGNGCGNVDVQTHGQSCRFMINGESETLKSRKAKSNRLRRIDSPFRLVVPSWGRYIFSIKLGGNLGPYLPVLRLAFMIGYSFPAVL
jgi:hypothetical protein